jgi:hypothetical protein
MMRPASTRAIHADALFASEWQRSATVFKGPEFCDHGLLAAPERIGKGLG